MAANAIAGAMIAIEAIDARNVIKTEEIAMIDHQLRRWALDRALESFRGISTDLPDERLIQRAAAFEAFVLRQANSAEPEADGVPA